MTEVECVNSPPPLNNNNEESEKINGDGEKTPERAVWGGKLEFIFSCLSYAVGLGNLWRFPYRCYENGGGAFLIPYVLILIFAGMPLFFFEVAFGQYASQGIISIWKVCPLMEGIGWGMFIVSLFVGTYYNMIVAWTIFYLFASLNTDVPWRGCENEWNTGYCNSMDLSKVMKNCSKHQGFYFNRKCYDINSTQLSFLTDEDSTLKKVVDDYVIRSKSGVNKYTHLFLPSYEYFHNYFLEISSSVNNVGGIVWKPALSLMAAWILICLCLIKGVKSQGKVVYFTALFPYIVIFILGIRVALLDGSMDGVMFYIKPDLNHLKQPKIWADAAVQIFFSLSPCWGGLITLSSYNKFNNNCYMDAVIVSIGNCLTSFIAGFVVFGSIGFMAHEMGTNVNEVAVYGSGLAFVAYPEMMASIKGAPFWSFVFFSMLLTLGIGTQFSVVTTVHTTIIDMYPQTLRKGKNPMYVMICLAVIFFFLGLPMTTHGGMYVLQIFDDYSASFSVLFIGFIELMTISYVYGIGKFSENIQEMLGKKPNIWFRFLWSFGTPVLIVGIVAFDFYRFSGSSYNKVAFPAWTSIAGLCMSFFSVSLIPIVAVYKIFFNWNGNLKSTVANLIKPSNDWGPVKLQEFQQQIIEMLYEGEQRLDSSDNFSQNEIIIKKDLSINFQPPPMEYTTDKRSKTSML